MSTLNQQTLAESRASDRPPILEKGSYVPWAIRFLRFLDNKQEEGERMRRSINIGPYERKMISDSDNPNNEIPEPISKMNEANKKQYFADIKVMNYLFQGITNDIYNSVDTCKDAKQMWERIKRLMHGSDITKQERHSRLMNEFDKFVAMEGESVAYVYERMTTLVNVMDQNKVLPLKIYVNTKFLNSLQPEWSKYATLTQEDSGTRLEPGSHKENPKTINDDDDDVEEKKDNKKDDDNDDDENDDHIDHTLVKDQVTGIDVTTESPTPATTSQDRSKTKRISNKYKHLPGALHRMRRRQGYMIQQMEKKYVTNHEFWKVHEKVDKVLYEIIPQIASRSTDDLIESNLKRVVADTVIQEMDALQAEVPALISKEFADHAPQIIEELFKIYMLNNVIQVHPTTSASTSTTTTVDLQQQLYLKMKDDDFRTQHYGDHQDDDTPLEGEKRAKRHKTSKSSKSARVVDEDEVIPEGETPKLINEFQNVDKHIPSIYDHARMEATLNDMMSNQSSGTINELHGESDSLGK
ncbi:hypothetical protein Tco_0858911 [Tanacetum coccineum]|uniref:Uncharacterized protein n=1 Tax=Tanacetum coccineum TaxID=301880 RepID=A0ABQ5BCB5_9ASTR